MSSEGKREEAMQRAITWGAGAILCGAMAVATAAGQGGPAGSVSDVEQIRAQLVGSYRLVWYKSYDKEGKETILPYTNGQISYDRAGRMSAQLVRSDQKKFTSTPPSEQERAAAYSAFISYFGAYDIDPVKRSVTHHVQGANNPGMTGNDLTRYFEFSKDGGTLYLTVKDGERVAGRLQWDKHR
jgi:hypothetical protein